MLRRLLFLWLLMFWQGGFVFYGTVVVTVGTDVLGSALEQGWITQRVTHGLNLAGVVALVAWAWDIAAEPDKPAQRRRRWSLWILLVLTLATLHWLHVRMDDLMNAESMRIADRPTFRQLHRWYLRISTAQWLGAVVLSWWTLQTWTRHDGQATLHGNVESKALSGAESSTADSGIEAGKTHT